MSNEGTEGNKIQSLPDGVNVQIARTTGSKSALHLCLRFGVGSGGVEPVSVVSASYFGEFVCDTGLGEVFV